MTIAEEIKNTTKQNRFLKKNITLIEEELKDLNSSLTQLQKELENYVSGGITGTSLKLLVGGL